MTESENISPLRERTRGPTAGVESWVVGLILLVVGFSAWRPIPAGVWHDDGVYMLIGQSLAEGGGLAYGGVTGSPPAAKFPPGYPIFLAVLWKLLGSIGSVTLAATLLNVLFVAGAGTLYMRILTRDVGMPVLLAGIVSVASYSSVEVLRATTVTLSESLFLLAVSAALFFANRQAGVASMPAGEGDRTDATSIAILAGLLTAAVMIRSVGIALVAGVVIAVLARRGLRTSMLVGLPASLAFIAWGRWSASATAKLPDGARDILGSYGGWWSAQFAADPFRFASSLPGHALAIIDRFGAVLFPGAPGVLGRGVVFALVPLAAWGTVKLSRRTPAVAWFVPAYLGAVLLWPFADRRLLVPIVPVVVTAVVLGTMEAVRRVDRRWIRAAAAAMGSVWLLAFSVVTFSRIADGWPSAAFRLRGERLAATVEALSRTVPANATVGAPEFWPALHLHGGYTVSPSARFLPRSDDESPLYGTPEQQIELWQAMEIDIVLAEHGGRVHGAALDALEEACPGTVFLLAQWPGSLLVRLNRSSPCLIGAP